MSRKWHGESMKHLAVEDLQFEHAQETAKGRVGAWGLESRKGRAWLAFGWPWQCVRERLEKGSYVHAFAWEKRKPTTHARGCSRGKISGKRLLFNGPLGQVWLDLGLRLVD